MPHRWGESASYTLQPLPLLRNQVRVLYLRTQEPPMMLLYLVQWTVDKAGAGFQPIDGAYLKLVGTPGKAQRRPLMPCPALEAAECLHCDLTGRDHSSSPSP